MVFKVPTIPNWLKAAKRGLAKPVSRKDPWPVITLDICNKFAGPNVNLSDLRRFSQHLRNRLYRFSPL